MSVLIDNSITIYEALEHIKDGKYVMPAFQRQYVWSMEQIEKLWDSILLDYPIATFLFWHVDDDNVSWDTYFCNFLSEVTFDSRKQADSVNYELSNIDVKMTDTAVLDGQQRLTSVYCSMYNKEPVPTQTIKKEDIMRFYYLDIAKCLDPEVDRVDAVVSIPADKKIKDNFGRVVLMDLSTREGEFENHMFPLNIVFDSIALDEWKDDYRDFHNDLEISKRLRRFTAEVLNPIILYTLPVIQLDRGTPKEAVCQVFENVNTGGVALTVFELVTATFAVDDFLLRDDWKMRASKMRHAEGTFELLSVVAATDFLSSITLLAQVKGNRTLAVKRKDVLSLALSDYKAYADDLTDGYIKAARFLVQQSILAPRDLPYTTQFVPLAVLMTVLGNKVEDGVVKAKLAAWYWCGVFGEMYGSANETRYVNDVSGVLAWISGGDEPDTVSRAFFHPTRLLSLQTRNGAAYKGVMALILGEGARDFISGDKMDFTNFVADYVDIHHVFPQKYCERQDYDKRKWNCIVNKTPIAYRTNRKLGGVAPSKYLKAIEETNVEVATLNANVESHGIDVSSLRNDDFDRFFAFRAKTLLNLIAKAMGKRINNLDSTEVIEAFGIPLE